MGLFVFVIILVRNQIIYVDYLKDEIHLLDKELVEYKTRDNDLEDMIDMLIKNTRLEEQNEWYEDNLDLLDEYYENQAEIQYLKDYVDILENSNINNNSCRVNDLLKEVIVAYEQGYSLEFDGVHYIELKDGIRTGDTFTEQRFIEEYCD